MKFKSLFLILGVGMFPFQIKMQPNLINGAKLPPKSVVFTIDDAPDEGGVETLKLAEYLYRRNIKATFFITGCHFAYYLKHYDKRSWICSTSSCSESLDIIRQIVDYGHRLGNHTISHVPLTEMTATEIVNDILPFQRVLLQFANPRHNNAIVPFRPPGLQYDNRVYRALYENDSTRNIIGPIGQDVGGQGIIGNTQIGGDWDCYNKNIPVSVCAEFYVNSVIRVSDYGKGHGSIILIHARSEYMPNGGNDFPLTLASIIVNDLIDLGYNFVDLTEALPSPRIFSRFTHKPLPYKPSK